MGWTKAGPGRMALGPIDPTGAPPEPLDKSSVDALQQALAIGDGEFRITVPSDVLVGLLAPFNTRARVILIHLLKGYSRGMSCVAAGVSEGALEAWEKKHPEFREATVSAYQMGFRRTFEPELYRRAMAGPDDRGSMRALELVTKARDSAYRDRSQIQHEIITRAQEATGSLTGGWQALPEPD